jgi:hypothetical protein
VLDACDAALACLEIVDSVWSGYRFTLEDNTADGSSAAWVVVGPPLPLVAGWAGRDISGLLRGAGRRTAVPGGP